MRPALGDFCFGTFDGSFVLHRIEPVQKLTFFHLRTVFEADLQNFSGDPGDDLHHRLGNNLTGVMTGVHILSIDNFGSTHHRTRTGRHPGGRGIIRRHASRQNSQRRQQQRKMDLFHNRYDSVFEKFYFEIIRISVLFLSGGI